MGSDGLTDHALALVGVFAVFLPALMLPGPDFVAVARASITHGARGGLLTTLGVSTGLCLYAGLSLVGLSALLAEFQWLTWVVRVLGGGYLVYLGVKLLRSGPPPAEGAATAPPSARRAVLFGLVVTLTNPKAIVLFASVFATAVTPATPGWLLAALVGLVGVASLAWYAAISVLMSSHPMTRRLARARRWIERTAGIAFIGFGGKLLADARNPVAP